MAFNYVVFSSYGNDSIAMLQLLKEYRLQDQRSVAVLYSDTGWAADGWQERVARAERWAWDAGFFPARTESIGFEALARKKKTFPRGRMQFCTSELKIFPAQRWLAEFDPEVKALCVNGVRRAESVRRRDTPVFTPISAAHGDRPLWSPLAEFSDDDRNALITRAGFEVLDHRSEECHPCIFASRKDLRRVPPERADVIRDMERGIRGTMYRPKAYMGAEGVDEVLRWANSERGAYKPGVEDDEPDCDSGFCGA